MMNFQKLIKIFFGISIFLLAATFSLSLYSFFRLINKSDWIEHTNLVLIKLEGILSIIKDAETGQRGYLLTENPDFLEPYIGSYYKVLQNYNDIRNLTRDNKIQQRRLDTLKLLINDKYRFINKSIELEKLGRNDSATALVTSARGKKIMDNIRSLIDRMKDEEIELKSKRADAFKISSYRMPIIIVATSFLSIIITLFFYLIARKEIKKEIALIDELNEKQSNLLEINEEYLEAQEKLKESNIKLEAEVEKRTREVIDANKQYRFVIDYLPQLVWTSDSKGRAIFFNNKWENYTGQAFQESENIGWTKVIHPEEVETVLKEWNLAVKLEKEFYCEFRMRNKEGSYRWFLATARPIKTFDEVKWFAIATDIQEQKDYFEEVKKNQKELKEKNNQLSEQNLRLQKINNDLDSFIYTASHDLKAPIANIEGLVNVLKKKSCYEDHESKQLIDFISTSSEKLKAVIGDLALIIRVQNEVDYDIEKLDIEEMVNEIKYSIPDLIMESNATIQVECSNCPAVLFSKRNFRSILFNLISNAIKYRSPDRKPVIAISSSRDKEYDIVKIKDNGLGIEAEKISKMFTMFRRFHNHVEGSGVGLFIVKRIIENSQGKIEVASEVGVGTTFTIYFPNNPAKETGRR